MIKIYVDLTKIKLNDKKAYRVIGQMEQSGEFTFIRGDNPAQDQRLGECQIFATNVLDHATIISEIYPEKTVYLIEYPLNQGYKSDHSNLKVVWCWDDFYLFVAAS